MAKQKFTPRVPLLSAPSTYMLSGMKPEEHYRLHGSLPDNVMQELFDKVSAIDALLELGEAVVEAKGQYPVEDFLSEAINRVCELGRRLKSENRETVRQIAKELDDIQNEVMNSSEYGREKLKQVDDAFTALY